jgi:hypothetical protein
LDGQAEHCVVASSGAGATIGRGQQHVDLGIGEVGDDGVVAAFGGDCQHPADVGGVFGMAQRGETEQRVDRGQSGVAGADAVASRLFEVVKNAVITGASRLVNSKRWQGIPVRWVVKDSSMRTMWR